MSLFEDDDWGRVVEGSGEYARVENLAGHLIIVFPIGYIDHHPTRFSQPGKKSDVIVCDVIDLDDVDDTGSPGKIYRTAWWRSAQLIMNLRPMIGKKILGRIGKGVPRNGMNPPWVINDVTAEPGALDRARGWGQAHPGFTVSVFSPPTAAMTSASPASPQISPSHPYPDFYQSPPPGYGQAQQPGYSPPQAPSGYPPAPGQPTHGQPNGYPQHPTGYPPPSQPPPPANFQAPPQQGGYPQQQQPPVPPQAPPPPAFPVPGAPAQDPYMLEYMRAQRARYEQEQAQAAGPWQDEQPPF